MTEQVFAEIWGMWPQAGKRRTDTDKKKKLTPMENARHLCFEALKECSPTVLIGAARSYVEGTGEGYHMGLHRWLRDKKWQLEDNAVTGNASKIEAAPVRGKCWEHATGEIGRCLKAMHEKGCPEDVLDGLYADMKAVTSINCDRGMKPTIVLGSHYGMNLFYKAASGYASRAGYNEIAYSPEYVEFARGMAEKRCKEGQIAAARDVSEPTGRIERAMELAEGMLDDI